MTAPTNADVIKAFSGIATPFTINDNLNASLATGATSQAQGLLARGEIVRVVQSVATGSVVLPTLTYGDAGGAPVVVINDSPNSINVGAAAGDKINGVATTASFGAGIQAVAAAGWGIFVPSTSPLGVGGVATVSLNNWHAAVGT
jgi:hypothetical protein